MPYYMQFSNRPFSSTIKPRRKAIIIDNNKLGKLEADAQDIENEYKNKMEL